MARWQKILDRILRGASDANIDFGDLRSLLAALGFTERIRGDHYIYTRGDVEEILNLQPRDGKAPWDRIPHRTTGCSGARAAVVTDPSGGLARAR